MNLTDCRIQIAINLAVKDRCQQYLFGIACWSSSSHNIFKCVGNLWETCAEHWLIFTPASALLIFSGYFQRTWEMCILNDLAEEPSHWHWVSLPLVDVDVLLDIFPSIGCVCARAPIFLFPIFHLPFSTLPKAGPLTCNAWGGFQGDLLPLTLRQTGGGLLENIITIFRFVLLLIMLYLHRKKKRETFKLN